MLTVGVDLAAEPANTAVARIRWTDDSAEVQAVGVGVDDPALVEEITASDNAGIDCPLVDTLTATAPWLTLGAHDRLCRRSDHALDALIAALNARAAALQLATTPSAEQARPAERQGEPRPMIVIGASGTDKSWPRHLPSPQARR